MKDRHSASIPVILQLRKKIKMPREVRFFKGSEMFLRCSWTQL